MTSAARGSMHEMLAPVAAALEKRGSLRIILLNDVGFVGGAGLAMRRQAQSFLQAGHDVSVVCWLETHLGAAPDAARGHSYKGEWLGLHACPDLDATRMPPARLAAAVCDKVLSFTPDLVIAGNLHWAKWPLESLHLIRRSGTPIVAYLHDCHWLTGRCAYFGTCRKFETGCDALCPTPTEYPPLERDEIANAYADRRRVFTGAEAVPLAANSRWTQAVAELAFKGEAAIDLLPLGVDTGLFAPFERRTARRLLGLPEEGILAVVGAVDLSEPRKGGRLLRDVIDRMASDQQVRILGFGHNSENIGGIIGLGSITDERVMPIVYNSADIMLNCANEESFGQTVLEASACGLPVVGLDVGGVPDIISDGETGYLLRETDAKQVADTVLRLAADDALRLRLGSAARRAVQDRFSLQAQAQAWQTYLATPLAAGG